jgi:hypothetical protein
MIAAVTPAPFTDWPPGWEDAEVVDSVLVDDPDPAAVSGVLAVAAAYDASGRVALEGRFGRLVSVLA